VPNGTTDEVLDAFADLGGDSRISVKRLNPGTQEYDFLDYWAPPDFDLQAVADRYGGGRYRARAFTMGDNGRWQPGRQRTFAIDESRTAKPGGSAGDAAPFDMQSMMNASMFGMFQMMMSTMMSTMRAQGELVRTAGSSQGDVMATAVEIAKLIKPGAAGGLDPLELAKFLAGQSTDNRDAWLEGLELGRSLEGAAGGESDLSAIVSMIGSLSRAADAQTKRLTAGVPNVPQPGAGGAAPGADRTPDLSHDPQKGAEMRRSPTWLPAVRPYLLTVVSMARARMDPDLAAEAIIRRLPDHVLDQLEGHMLSPDFVDQALEAMPKLQPFRPWAIAVLDEMRDQLTEAAAAVTNEDGGSTADSEPSEDGGGEEQ
jgi:hypothetical protein